MTSMISTISAFKLMVIVHHYLIRVKTQSETASVSIFPRSNGSLIHRYAQKLRDQNDYQVTLELKKLKKFKNLPNNQRVNKSAQSKELFTATPTETYHRSGYYERSVNNGIIKGPLYSDHPMKRRWLSDPNSSAFFSEKESNSIIFNFTDDYFETDFDSNVSILDFHGNSLDSFDNYSSYMNISTLSSIPQPYELWQFIVIIILTVLLSTVTIMGNLLVLFSFAIERTLRQPTNYYIVSLAISDLIIGVSSMPFYSLYLLVGSWPLGEILCDLWLSTDYTVCLASQYTVFFITLDRYCSVNIPAKYRNWRTPFKVKFMIYCAWGIPISIFFIAIFGWQYFFGTRGVEADQCYVPFRDNRVFNTSLIFFYYWSTLVVLLSLYAGIYKVAYDLAQKSIEKEKRAKAIVQNALLNKKSIREGTSRRRASKTKYSKEDGLLSLKTSNNVVHETTSFSKEEKREKDKSSSISFPSDESDSDEFSESGDVAITKGHQKDKNKISKSGRSNKANKPHRNEKKHAKTERESYSLEKKTTPMTFKKEIDGLAEGLLSKSDAKSETPDVRVIEKTCKVEKVDTMTQTILSYSSVTTPTPRTLYEIEASQRFIGITNLNIYITTNTPTLTDYDIMSESNNIRGNNCLQKNPVLMIQGVTFEDTDKICSKDNKIKESFAEGFKKNFKRPSTTKDRKNLFLPGLKQSYETPGKLFKSPVPGSLSFQSTNTTLTPLTPFVEDIAHSDNTKDTFLSSSVTPSLVDTNGGKHLGDNEPGIVRLPSSLKERRNKSQGKAKDAKTGRRRNSSMFSSFSVNAPQNMASSSVEADEDKMDKGIGSKIVAYTKINGIGKKGERRKMLKFGRREQEGSDRKKSKSENRARKALRTITCIMGAFILCWTPYHICETIRGFNPDFPINTHFYNFTYWLCYLNSPLNPFMYALANQQFKKTFIRILKCDFRKS
ncbi:unnamed protein product [Gordionus sp. m RMFG-2023]|uniref:probable muscarinic acetylcholine receptor gar-1 n=1 Tax=Gordionus sp. m RMFG-2023 TaxID=3053472 RepID=UPI0030E422C1